MARIPSGGGVVSAASPEAAAAGAQILVRGGNAIDAAVAVSLALGVTEPSGSGIGGQASFIVQRPGEPPFVINGSSVAPRTTPADVDAGELVAHRATTVPSCLRVLDFAWRRHGSGGMRWAELVEPSIRAALDGYELGPFRQRALVRHAAAIRRSAPATHLLLAADGSVPETGSRVLQPTLGRTLQRIAEAGAEDFYRGEIARAIAEDMAFHDGWLDREDLAALPEPQVLKPLTGSYRGWDLHALPPPASGWIVLLALNLLEQAPAGALAVDGPERIIWTAEALRIAQRQRQRRAFADAAASESQLLDVLSKQKARRLLRSSMRWGGGETTHFSVVDTDGTLVGVTQSLNSYYGAKTAARDLGFLYNDYMREFLTRIPNHPFALRPGGRPMSFMSACILAHDGRPALVLGSPGDDRIISAVVQVISRWVDGGLPIDQAVAAPRLHVPRGEALLLETLPADRRALVALEERGYTIYRPINSLFAGELNPYFGGVHAVAKEQERWVGAADPRRDGAVETC